MRLLDKLKITYKINTYECDEFHDGIQVADMLSQSYDQSFKTLVTVAKSGEHYVFVIPIAKELDLKAAAKLVGEKNVEMIHVKDINKVTGYIRGGCTPLGMKKHYKTVFDSTAQNFDEIIISGGRIGAQIIASPLDLAKAAEAVFGDITVD